MELKSHLLSSKSSAAEEHVNLLSNRLKLIVKVTTLRSLESSWQMFSFNTRSLKRILLNTREALKQKNKDSSRKMKMLFQSLRLLFSFQMKMGRIQLPNSSNNIKSNSQISRIDPVWNLSKRKQLWSINMKPKLITWKNYILVR